MEEGRRQERGARFRTYIPMDNYTIKKQLFRVASLTAYSRTAHEIPTRHDMTSSHQQTATDVISIPAHHIHNHHHHHHHLSPLG